MAKYFKLLIQFIFLPIYIFSQDKDIKFDQLTMYSGLSNNIVVCILQDSKGFMWFGTRNGLNRYDGNTFKIYQHDPENPNSISENKITALHEDKSGNILIGTFGEGMDTFDPRLEIFRHYKNDKNNSNSLANNSIKRNAIFEDSKRNIWIGTEDGLSLILASKQSQNSNQYNFINIKHDLDSLSTFHKNVIRSFYEDKNNNMWIGTQDGCVSKVDLDDKKLINYISSNDIYNFLNNGDSNWDPGSAFLIFQDESDPEYVFTIGSSRNMYKYNCRERKIIEYHKKLNDLVDKSRNFAYYRNENGTIWIGLDKGLFRIENWKSNIDIYKYNSSKPYSISPATIATIYKDHQGTFWCGTYGGGINKFNPGKQNFIYHEIIAKGKKFSIFSIFKDESASREIFWLGTMSNGLLKYDKKKDQITQFKGDIRSAISTIYRDPNNEYLWMGDLGSGLYKFDLQTEKFCGHYFPSHGIDSEVDVQITATANIIRDIKSAKSDNLWIATHYGLYLFNPDTETFTPFLHEPNVPASLSSNKLLMLFKSPVGEDPYIWIGTRSGGLNKFNPETNQFFHYMHDRSNINSISGNEVWTICEDKPGFLLIGTNKGLNRFQLSNDKFYRILDKDKTLNIEIHNVFKDKHNDLWLNTAEGLYKYDSASETVRVFDYSDGIPARTLNEYSLHKDKNGIRYFGIYGGFIEFNPDSFITNTNNAKSVLTDFQIFNKSIKPGKDSPLHKSIAYTDEIILSYKHSVFSFEFAALDFNDPGKNKYAYKMEGVDPDWVFTDASRRFATYTNLDPGEYTFWVKGSNNDGVWNEEGTSIRIIITPPWWRTNIAYAIYLLMIGSIVCATWRIQQRRIHIKQQLNMEHFEAEKLREVDQLKSRFFANISHEFRTPLTLIKGPVKQIMDGKFAGNLKEQCKMILRNSDRLLALINQILDISKLESGEMKLKVSEIDIIKYVKGLVLSFSSLADRKNISLKLDYGNKHIFGYIDLDKFEKIVTNLLSNAFKFTPEGGMIEVVISEPTPPFGHPSRKGNSNNPLLRRDKGVGEKLQITISNTGDGIPADQLDKIFDRFYQIDDNFKRDSAGTGIGLALTKELVEVCHGEISVECSKRKQPPESPLTKVDFITTFTIWLPIEKKSFKENGIIDTPVEELDSPLAKGARSEGLLTEGMSEIGIESTEVKGKEAKSKLEKSAPILLIVEDNPDVTSYISSFMENEYRILTAENGKLGLKKTLDKYPDLIISDVMMPEMDGFEFCQKVKSDERISHIPVILLTAKADLDSKIEGLEFGADDYVTKPFEALELQIRSKNLIEQRKKLREKFSALIDLKPEDISASSMDEQLLQRLLSVFEDHITEPEYNIEKLSREVGISRVHLNRKIQSLTNLSTRDFIRTLRLQRAAQLFKNASGTVSEIAYKVGFQNLSHFSKAFRKHFGKLPSDF